MKPALCNNKPIPRTLDITQHLFGLFIDNGSTQRNRQDDIVAGFPRTVSATTRLAILSAKFSSEPVVHHGVKRGTSLKNHTPTITAIPTIGATKWNILFPAKTDTAIPALSGVDLDYRFVDKLHVTLP
jgi:hypothetical protein